jgi:hypothetical protein
MAVGAICKMCRYRCTRQGILMTGDAVVRTGCRDKTAVVRCRYMDHIPIRGMTRLTVAASCKGLAGSTALKRTVCRAMAVGAVNHMRRSCETGHYILMTGGAVISTGSRYKAAVIRSRCMDVTPRSCMTRLAVTADYKGLTDGSAYKRTVCIAMAVGAVFKMRRICSTSQCILMTGGTVVSKPSRYKTAVIWSRYMDHIPVRGMTRLAVAASLKVLADCCAYKRTVWRAMAVRAVLKMRRICGTRQSILMTITTTNTPPGTYKAAVIRMVNNLRIGMTRLAVAASCKGLAGSNAMKRPVFHVMAVVAIFTMRIIC